LFKKLSEKVELDVLNIFDLLTDVLDVSKTKKKLNLDNFSPIEVSCGEISS